METTEQMTFDIEEQKRLLVEINTKLTILLASFDKHVEEDKNMFKIFDNRIRNLERVYWLGIGAIVMIEFIVKFIK